MLWHDIELAALIIRCTVEDTREEEQQDERESLGPGTDLLLSDPPPDILDAHLLRLAELLVVPLARRRPRLSASPIEAPDSPKSAGISSSDRPRVSTNWDQVTRTRIERVPR